MDWPTLNAAVANSLLEFRSSRVSILLLSLVFLTSGQAAPINADEHYYAVVGAVSDPQSITVSDKSVDVDELLKLAGGLTPVADGTVRIIHPTHGNERFFVSGGAGAIPVPPNSVVVAVPASNTPHGGGSRHEYYDVTCLNLWDRPVVCRLPADAANRDALAQAIGLPSAAVDEAQLTVSAPGHANEELLSGSVLDFAGVEVDRSGLGDVPTGPSLNVAVATPTKRVLERGPWPADSASGLMVTPVANTPLVVETPSAVLSTANADVAADTCDLFAGPENAVDTGLTAGHDTEVAEAITPVSAEAPLLDIPLPPETAEVHAAASSDVSAPPVPSHKSERIRSTEPIQHAGAPASSWIPAIVIALLALGGLAVAIVWSSNERSRRHPLGATTETTGAASVPEDSDSVFEELINDTLPLLVEEPRFPEHTRLQGQVVGFRHLILHQSHQSRGPHLLRRRRGELAQPAMEAQAEQLHAHRQRVGDSVSDAASSTRSSKPAVPATATPLERALWIRSPGGGT